MRIFRLRTAGLAALPLAALAVLAPAGSASAAPDLDASASVGHAVRAQQATLLATSSEAATLVAADPADPADSSLAAARTATFRVTYNGFTPAARASFQRAVDIWSTRVVSSVPITINATFQPLGPGVLGSAGPYQVYRDFAGAPQKATWYVDAIANKRAGKQLDPHADILANFSSSFDNWHYAATPAPKGTYDFESVVLHELGHGLGFLGAGRVADGKGSVRLSGYPVAYDRYTENAAGRKLVTFADPSQVLADQITGNKLFFDSPQVRYANDGKAAKLYAPATFQPGSSYSHLDDATYRAGNRNSLMTHAIGDGETIRTPGPIMNAMFKTIGW